MNVSVILLFIYFVVQYRIEPNRNTTRRIMTYEWYLWKMVL
jgi:hypothetical protein